MEDQNDVLDLDFSNLVVATLDDELLLRQLGRLSVAFNALEEGVRNLLGELVDSPPTKGVNFTALLEWFAALGRSRLSSRDSAYLKEFNAFIDACKSASEKRNLYVHGRWYESEGTTLFISNRDAARNSPPKQKGPERRRGRAAARPSSGEPRQVTDRDVGAAADACARLAEELWSTWPSRLGLLGLEG
jgi:hypothetical protein